MPRMSASFSRGNTGSEREAAVEMDPVPEMRQSPRATTLTYVIALLAIAALSLFSDRLTSRIVARQHSTARLVNTAGRQRMLAQRSARLADEVAYGAVDRAAGRQEMLQMATRMQAAQQQLAYGDAAHGFPPPDSSQLHAIYFGEPYHLEQQVNSYLTHVQAFASKIAPDPHDPDLLAVRLAIVTTLPEALDAAVSQYQAAAEDDIRHLQHILHSLTAAMLMVLVLEALCIYRPLFRRLSKAIALLLQASTTDFLSGAMNRRAFLSSAARELSRTQRKHQTLCFIMADLDGFKQINDTHGHAVGDMVIQRFVAEATAALRKEDLIGRVGGEEFAFILPDTSPDGGLLAAERLRERFSRAELPLPSGGALFATVSIGMVCVDGGSVESILAQADAALYRAKHLGRNRTEAGAATPDIAQHQLAGVSPAPA